MEEKFYTIDQLAERLGMHRNTIVRLIQNRKLAASLFGSRYRISESQLNDYVKRNTIQPTER